MKAIRLAAFGAPDALQAVDSPTPEPRPDQMLVRVAGCGVCGHDLLNRAGHFPHTPLPCVMGHEVAGEVVEVNQAIADDPSLVNSDPAGAGWFFKLKLDDAGAAIELMDETAYQAMIG